MTTPLDAAIRAGCCPDGCAADAYGWALRPCGERKRKEILAALSAFIENPHLGISYECLQTLRRHLGEG